MTPLFLTVRAISSEFARRMYVPVIWGVGAGLAVLLGLIGWLTMLSGWWWLLETLLIFGAVVFTIIALIAGLGIHLLRPTQSKEQRKMVGSFVNKLQEASEIIQTPKFILLFRLAKDTIFPSEDGLVNRVVGHASSLKPDFSAIINSFKK